MAKVLVRLDVLGATVHGFRSAFCDWAEKKPAIHASWQKWRSPTCWDKAEQAYRRSDALEKRRALMGSWQAWCEAEAAGGAKPD